jgi:prepilin-type N-terminal cleavage/methylation domain-containing protein
MFTLGNKGGTGFPACAKRFIHRPESLCSPKRGFTLLEMLVVIGIIAVLLGMLYSALERTRKFSRYTITYNELKQIQAAFEQYYSFYHTWPTNGITTPLPSEDGEDVGFIITRDIALAMQGATSPLFTDENTPNPDKIPFMEFPRFNGDGDPVNPFRTTRTDQQQNDPRCYVVLFDTSGNRQIAVPPDNLSPSATSTTIVANVAIWTVVPGFRTSTGSGEGAQAQPTGEMRLGSWDKFDLSRPRQ